MCMQRDVHELRRLASIRGLVNPFLRRAVWPLLLGVHAAHDTAMPCLLHSDGNSRASRDEQTIHNDVARCLHESQVDVGGRDRDALRESLTRLLKAVVDGKNVFYYQVLSAHSLLAPPMPGRVHYLLGVADARAVGTSKDMGQSADLAQTHSLITSLAYTCDRPLACACLAMQQTSRHDLVRTWWFGPV
jgi:hypothetical protein